MGSLDSRVEGVVYFIIGRRGITALGEPLRNLFVNAIEYINCSSHEYGLDTSVTFEVTIYERFGGSFPYIRYMTGNRDRRVEFASNSPPGS